MSKAVIFDKVNIVFGDKPETALPLMDQGMSRPDIQQETNQVLGVRDCSLEVEEGEIVVLMAFRGPASPRCCARLRAQPRGARQCDGEEW